MYGVNVLFFNIISENVYMIDLSNFRKVEDIFYDIINYIKSTPNNDRDMMENISIYAVHYYKYHNFGEKTYVYESSILLSDDVYFYFYLSPIRTYFAVWKNGDQTDLDYVTFQYILLKYCDKLVTKYHLSEFVYDISEMGMSCINKMETSGINETDGVN
jgi:hypothetical protein